jgi:MoaA/NifB/PqqE/SkfB family radical SAM enzyme
VARLIIERFTAADRNIWLTTNGINIREPLFSSLLRNAKGLLVSLVGTDTESYTREARHNGFERVMQTLDTVLDARRLINSPLRINVTHVFNMASLPALESLILRLNDMEVDEFRCRYDLFSNPSDLQNISGKETLLRVAQKYPDMRMRVMLKSPPDETLPEEYECYAPFIWPTWNLLHGVYPCAHVTNEKNKIESSQANGVYSLVNITEKPEEAVKQNCHRRCPSRIHWFNLFLNNHELGISDIPQASILIK